MTKSVDVAVIGGGVIGLAIARAAAQRGATVIVIEADRLGRAASFANAGLIVPSFSLPLSNPEAIKGLPGLLWGDDRSLNLKLRPNPGFLRWILAFLGASRRENMLKTAAVRSRLGQRSLALFSSWDPDGSAFGLRPEGWLHLYQTESGWRTGLAEAELIQELGLPVEEWGPAQVAAGEPGLSAEVVGGLYFPSEARLRPYRLCQWLAEQAAQLDVKIFEGMPVVRLTTDGHRIAAAELPAGTVVAQSFVIATGAWSSRLVRPLIGWLPLEPAKGYSLTYRALASKPTQPLMWAEKHVVMTPYSDKLRLTTGLDLVGFDDGLDPAAIAKLRASAEPWLASEAAGEPWYGYRPLTPDGLPILGPTARYRNLFLATGHGQLGMTLAPASGEIMADQLMGEDPGPEALLVSPARFGL